jgi:fructose-bisphosphate aldolase class I
MGLDGLDKRCAEYYKAGARFSKWRSVVSIPAGPSMIALRDCAYGLARYAAIAQHAGLVPIVEPEVMLDGEQDIDRCLEVQEAIWAETFKYMADNKVSKLHLSW